MATQLDSLFKSFLFQNALSANVAVALSATADMAVPATSSATPPIGFLQEDVATAGYALVKLLSQTQLGTITNAPVTRGNGLYVTTGGLLSLATAGVLVGFAGESTGSNGAIIEVYQTGI